MKDQLISFDTAKLAKEKGFPVAITMEAYNENRELRMNPPFVSHSWTNPEGVKIHKKALLKYSNFIAAPTQSLLQKWLGEKHNILLWLHLDYGYEDNPVRGWIVAINDGITGKELEDESSLIFYKTYEAALEAGLIEALKLIK